MGDNKDFGFHMSPGNFHQLGRKVLEQCSTFLERNNGLPLSEAVDKMANLMDEQLPEVGLGPEAIEALDIVGSSSVFINGKWFAYIRCPSDPVAAFGDLFASVTNQIVSQWTSSPSGCAIELTTARWICEALKCPNLHGIFTSGGSMSNLMALTIARDKQAPKIQQNGCRGQPQLIVYASQDVHFTIKKAMSILGLGTDNLHLLEMDSNCRLQPETLKAAIEEDRAKGLQPMALVVNAGTLGTGAIDPLEELADLAHSEGLWVHADGSYGGMAAIARPELFKGLWKMDSVAVDAHKWLYAPVDCGLLLFSDMEASRKSFPVNNFMVKPYDDKYSVKARSVFFCELGIESTRRSRALKLWLSLRYHGLAKFRDSISSNLDVAQTLGSIVENHPLLELMVPVHLSAVCFRFKPLTESDEDILEKLNDSIHYAICKSGQYFIKPNFVKGRYCLRACLTDFNITASIAEDFVDYVVKVGEEIAQNGISNHVM